MPYFIKHLSTEIDPKGKYFFDANVWLFLINPPFNERKIRPYLAFFEKLANNPNKPKPKIVITSLVLSEVINRHLRSITMKEFFEENPTLEPSPSERKNRYKDIYRQSPQFARDYKNICDNIKSYNKYAEFINDDLSSFKFKQVLKAPPIGLDFNDYYYCLLAKKYELTIVTDDSDFFVEDIKILTANRKLLDATKQ